MNLKPLSERPTNAPVFGEAEYVAIRLDYPDLRVVSSSGLEGLAKFTNVEFVFGSLKEARETLLNSRSAPSDSSTEIPELKERNNALASEVAHLKLKLERIKSAVLD